MNETFDAEKAVQVAVLFIELNGGCVDRYALIKMIYDADRHACERWGHSMTGDAPISMEHGPALSRICDLTKGTFGPDAARWNEIIGAADEEHIISLKKALPDKDRLSTRDVKIISEVYQKLGNMSFAQLKKWSHALPEYTHVEKGEVRDIPAVARLHAVGKTEKEIALALQETAEDDLIRTLCGIK